MSSHISVLRGILSEGTIAFHAVFAKAFRSLPVGVFLSQSYFWQENRKFRSEKTHREIDGKQFFTKTAKEWFDETGLSVEQQQKVRSILCTASVLEERLAGNPAKMFYHIDFEALVSVINRYLVDGFSASVDNRNKNGFKTQTRRGKKPKQVSVENQILELDKNPNSYNKESLESFESEGERTPPAPNPSNLKEEKKENGLVASGRVEAAIKEYLSERLEDLLPKAEIPPSPNSAAPPSPVGNYEPSTFDLYGPQPLEIMEGETLAEMEERLIKQTNGTFQVTAIASPTDIPGVTIVEAVPKLQPWEHPNPQSPKELKNVLLRYADQNPENWRDNVLESGRAKNWPPEKLSECLQEFCDWQFKTDFTKGKISQYTAGFSLWLKRQPRFEAMNAPKDGGATRGAQHSQKSHINGFGSDPAKYAEKPLF